MRPVDLRKEIYIEYEFLDKLKSEINKILNSIPSEKPDATQITALSAYALQFYTIIENILKRISKFNKLTLPKGSDWHLILFNRFSDPPFENLPLLFDDSIKDDFIALRKFRHYFFTVKVLI